MLTFISENIATVIISLILIAIAAGINIKLLRDKKNGKPSCGCGCENCPMSGICHSGK